MDARQAYLLDMKLEEVMRKWPASVDLFMEYKMLCVGCIFTQFHTVVDACHEHNVDLDEFCEKLLAGYTV